MSTIKYYDTTSASWKYLPQGPVGPQGPPGPSGSGSGDMVKVTYDPANISQQVVGTTATQTITNKNLTSGTNTFPTFNQNTTGTAAGLSANIAESQVTNLTTDLAAKAPIASPTFTGTTTSATQAVTNTNGTLMMTSVTDGADFNIYHTASGTKTLAFYGSGANTLNVSILDGTLDIAGALVPTISSTSTLTNKRVVKRTNATTSSATPSINTDITDEFDITALAANITSMTTNLTGTPNNGDELMIRFKDNGTARSIAWGASFVSSGVATLLASTVISKTHYVKLRYDSAAAKWVCMAVDANGY